MRRCVLGWGAAAAAWLLVPLRILYFNGPAWSGWGFWEGRPPDDICAELTHVDARHWRDDHPAGPDACADLLDRKFSAFAIGVAAAVMAATAIAACTQSIAYCFTVRPLLKRVDHYVSAAFKKNREDVVFATKHID